LKEEKIIKSNYYCLDLTITNPLIKDVESENYTSGKRTADISIENIYFSFNRELLSKLLYFTIDFARDSKAFSGVGSGKSSKKGTKFPLMMNSLLKMDESYKTLKVRVRSVVILVTHSTKPLTVGLRMVPSYSLQKNQIQIDLKEMQMFYNEDRVDLKNSLNITDELKQIPQFLRPVDLNLTLLRGTTNRLSLDAKLTDVEIFFSEAFLDNCSQIACDFGSLRLLDADSFMADLRSKASKGVQPSKKKQLVTGRLVSGVRKSSVQSRRPTASRKASGSQLGNSEMMDDEFFDAFEDETELFAHNELKSKFDLLETVGMLMPSQLAVIEETHKFATRDESESEEQELLSIEVALGLAINEIVLVAYGRNDSQSYMQANVSQLRVFSDFKEFSLKINDVSIFLKPNLLTLLMKDLGSPIASILSMVSKSNPDGKGESPKEGYMSEKKIEESSPDSPTHDLRIFQKNTETNQFSSLKTWLLSCSENISVEIEIENGLSLYMTQQIGQVVTPGMLCSIKPHMTLNAKVLKFNFNFKLDVFNEEIGFYEPFIEELALECIMNAENSNLTFEAFCNTFLLNLKPSILKNLFDYLSLYSSQKIKSSAEKNSVITIKNETGVVISYLVNQSGLSKSLKPYEVVNVNLVFMPQTQEAGTKLRAEHVDHSISCLSFVENKSNLLKIVGRVGDDKINITNFEPTKQLSTSFFSKKKLQLDIPSFGVRHTLDLSDMTDAHLKLTNHIFLVAKLEVDHYHTVLTLRSNYKITNKLDFDVECSAYLHKNAYAKEDTQVQDLFNKKRKKSEVLSEGDNLSVADSMDLSVNEPIKRFNFSGEKKDRAKTIAFEITEASEKEERNILLFKFVIKSKGHKYLPLLKNFPKNYFILVRPAQLEFFESISSEPTQEINQIKNQTLKQNRVYFEDIFKRNCSSMLTLKYSVDWCY
jgi:hypothetical protein